MEVFLNITSSIPVFALILLSATGVITGDYFAKSWSENHQSWRFALSLVGYLCSGIFYIPTLLRDQLVVTSIMWSFLSILGFLVIGIIIFHETFDHLQIAGIIFGVLSLLLFSLSNHWH
jgi:multidrug transporter EmrE-like cation transporter